MQPLLNSLTLAGKPPLHLAFPDGTRLLVLASASRALGLYSSVSEENFLWTNPVLDEATSGKAFFASDQWHNAGGDRTWLAPEIELFIGDLARPAETYGVQPALDPGSWTLASVTDTEIHLATSTTVRLHRSGRNVSVQMGKQYGPAVNPLQDTPLARSGLQYAGYTQVTTLELEPAEDAVIRLGIWNLLQLPPPGEMLIATLAEVRPRFVFGAASVDELTVAPRLVRWTMGGDGDNAKISLKAPLLSGRAGYLRRTPVSGIWDLVVREFSVDPQGDYVDALWEHPHETGWAFQACCVRVGSERFNELEYHAPAVTALPGVNRGRDESRVWAFRGPHAAIVEAAGMLLETM